MSNKTRTWSRLLALFGTTVVAFAFAAMLSPTVFAGVPQGTMTGAVQTLTAGTTAAINTITVTDNSTAEISVANDIRIRIPATVNAIWDTSDTTATVSTSASGVVSGTVSYADADKTLVLDVTTLFGNSETVTISDLSLVPTAASTAVALDWAIDGVSPTYLAGNANTEITIDAADPAAAIDITNIAMIGTSGTIALTLTTPVALAVGDTVKVTFPSNFSISGVNTTAGTATSTLTSTPTFTASQSGQVLTLTAVGTAAASTGVITIPAGIISLSVASASTITTVIYDTSATANIASASDDVIAETIAGAQSGDTTAPSVPTEVSLSINSSNQVTITWVDPTDSDLDKIEILRGVSSLPVSGTTFDAVGKGVETYTDSDVSVGDVVKYILRSKDSSDNTSISEEYSITVTASSSSTTTTTTLTTTTSTPTTTTTTTTQTQTQSQNRYGQAGVTETQVDSAVSSFSDLLKDAWHAPFIARMKNLAILAGYPDGTVKPDNTINRAELAKIAAKAFDLSSATETFSDVADDAWFAPFVGALQSVGAAWTTTSDYQPSGDVTRGEALQTLLVAAGVDLDGVDSAKLFPDVGTKHRFAAAITYASQNGVVSGYDNGNFGPGDTLTRGQVAKIVSLIKDL